MLRLFVALLLGQAGSLVHDSAWHAAGGRTLVSAAEKAITLRVTTTVGTSRTYAIAAPAGKRLRSTTSPSDADWNRECTQLNASLFAVRSRPYRRSICLRRAILSRAVDAVGRSSLTIPAIYCQLKS